MFLVIWLFSNFICTLVWIIILIYIIQIFFAATILEFLHTAAVIAILYCKKIWVINLIDHIVRFQRSQQYTVISCTIHSQIIILISQSVDHSDVFIQLSKIQWSDSFFHTTLLPINLRSDSYSIVLLKLIIFLILHK